MVLVPNILDELNQKFRSHTNVVWFDGETAELRAAIPDEMELLKKEERIWAFAYPGYVLLNNIFLEHDWPTWPPSKADILQAVGKYKPCEGVFVLVSRFEAEDADSAYERFRRDFRLITLDPEIQFFRIDNIFFAKFNIKHRYCQTCFREARKLGNDFDFFTFDSTECERLKGTGYCERLSRKKE